MGFEAITTQEAFDAAVNGRIEEVRSEYKDYEQIKSDLAKAKKQLGERDNTINGLNSQIRGYKAEAAKMRIAHEVGLPMAMANRLTGETDDEIRRDAAELVKLMGKQSNSAWPMASAESEIPDKSRADMRALLENLKED